MLPLIRLSWTELQDETARSAQHFWEQSQQGFPGTLFWVTNPGFPSESFKSDHLLEWLTELQVLFLEECVYPSKSEPTKETGIQEGIWIRSLNHPEQHHRPDIQVWGCSEHCPAEWLSFTSMVDAWVAPGPCIGTRSPAPSLSQSLDWYHGIWFFISTPARIIWFPDMVSLHFE